MSIYCREGWQSPPIESLGIDPWLTEEKELDPTSDELVRVGLEGFYGCQVLGYAALNADGYLVVTTQTFFRGTQHTEILQIDHRWRPLKEPVIACLGHLAQNQ